MDVVNTIEAELMEFMTDIEGVSKLNEGELVNLRRTFTEDDHMKKHLRDKGLSLGLKKIEKLLDQEE